MSGLPVLFLREYRLTEGEDWESRQIVEAPTFNIPVTWFTFVASMADPIYSYYLADMDTTLTPGFRTTPWSYESISGTPTGESYYKQLFRYYAADGVAPPMRVNSVLNPPVIGGSKMLGVTIIQFALPGKVTTSALTVSSANHAAFTIPGAFTGERYLLSFNSLWYQSSRTSQDDEARFTDVSQRTDFPLWDAASASDLALVGRSYVDLYADFLNPGAPFPTRTDAYVGLYATMTSTKVSVGDVINFGTFSNTTLSGQTWNALILETDGNDYDPAGALNSFNRVRSSMSEDTGSILDSVTVNTVDLGISESTLLSSSRSSSELNPFAEAMNPDEIALTYHAMPEQSREFLNDYSGETLLSRMSREFAPAVIGLADELFDGSLPTFTIDTTKFATPQSLLTGVLTEWAQLFPWFSFRPVPDLRLRVRNPTSGTLAAATPTQYQADATLGRIGSALLSYEQDKDTRLTMRQLLDELLSPFPGTVLRVAPGNQLEIVPAYGPDAAASSAVVLSDKDVYEITSGVANPLGIINECTVTSTPYTVTVDAGVMVQSWFRLRSNVWVFGSPDQPGDGTGVELTNPSIGDGKPAFGWNPQAWQMQANTFSDGEIKLKNSSNDVEFTIDYYAQASTVSGTHTPAAAEVNNIPVNGTTVVAVKTRIFVGDTFNPNCYLRIELHARYNAADKTVIMWPSGVNDFEPTFNFAANPCSVVVQLQDATNKWEQGSTTVSATYGEGLLEDDYGDLGGALSASMTAFGRRAVDLAITGYGINDVQTVQAIAHAYVMEAISPLLVRQVDQSAWRAFPIRFEHVGLPVTLPDSSVGLVIGRSYADDYGLEYADGNVSSIVDVEVLDASAPGYVDVTVEYLLLDSGELLVLDDYSLAEVS